ncbi:RTA1-domain-containing protein [Lentithecium fluviatile CBS 122367]|uniref:RTA1-domain-containing protein n=1 Tax=Lentithecium fluviatile CBS 122367 TaxID=1168545 RepID=A0A6G1JJY2_9PLEO|nr:RTA1-domain-containing protein [Lentithecium fluviatile CBS 122367]
MANGESIWLYSPSTALAIVVAIIFLVPTLALTWQTVIKYRSWFFLCVLIGSALEVGGYICRAVSANRVTEIPPYAISSSLIVIAPVFIAAGNYLLLGRLIRAVLSSKHHRIFLIPAHRITRIFVACDILTFFIQCSGTSIASSDSWEGEMATVGTNVLIGGLALQAGTLSWFLSIVARFWWATEQGVKEDAPKGWGKVWKAICVSTGLSLVRSIYRVIEFALGIEGYPFQHEWMFYVFEALPMVPAIAIFCFIHPAKYLGSKGRAGKLKVADSGTELESGGVIDARRERRK